MRKCPLRSPAKSSTASIVSASIEPFTRSLPSVRNIASASGCWANRRRYTSGVKSAQASAANSKLRSIGLLLAMVRPSHMLGEILGFTSRKRRSMQKDTRFKTNLYFKGPRFSEGCVSRRLCFKKYHEEEVHEKKSRASALLEKLCRPYLPAIWI